MEDEMSASPDMLEIAHMHWRVDKIKMSSS